MTLTIIDKHVNLQLAQFTTQKKILAPDWKRLPGSHNRLFSDLGVEIPGRSGFGSSPIWSTTNTSYTQTDGDGGDVLSSWQAVSRGWRYLSGATPLQFQFDVFCQHLDFQLLFRSLQDGSTLENVTFGGSSSLAWRRGVVTLTLAEATIDGLGVSPVPIAIDLRARWRSTGAKADLYAWHGRERVLRSTDTTLLPG